MNLMMLATTRSTLALVIAACLMVGCQRDRERPAEESGQPTVTSAATPEGTAASPTATSDAATGPAEKADTGFDPESVPLSTAILGGFPYLKLPDGYRMVDRKTQSFDISEFPFWTDAGYEWVEGRLQTSTFRAEKGKEFSELEVVRNIEQLIASVGGMQVGDGKAAADSEDAARVRSLLGKYKGALCYPTLDVSRSFVIRRSDRVIWVHLCARNNEGGLAIAETTPLDITASLLPADEMKRQLDESGKVSLQVNFAVDKADILPDSQPQIDQVVALLRQDPALELSVNGHTDDTGDADHNLALSRDRARAVVDAIVGQGIDSGRLVSEGFGQTQPIADNATEAGRASNRRVELRKRG